tara:strand:- start:531 stop:1775 length:1245 start_codon:yes stop_codon:yes gene_type:complete
MALPLLALGKIVSGVVAGTAKGLTVAGKATAKGSKVVGRAAGKAAYAGGELVYDVASAAKQGLIKGIKATPNALKKAASSTRKIMSNFGKRMSKRKTSGGIEKLKRNSEKIRNKLNRDVKKLKKQRLDRDRIQRNVLERGEVRKMEKNIESTKTPTGKKVQSVLKSPLNIIDKLFGLGGILLTGIIVNSIEAIINKWKEFKENNKGIFDFLGKIINGVADFLGGVKISKLKTEGLEMDEFAVFNEEGDIIGGKLLVVKKTVDGFATIISAINKALNMFKGGNPDQNVDKSIKAVGREETLNLLNKEQEEKKKEGNRFTRFFNRVIRGEGAEYKEQQIRVKTGEDRGYGFFRPITPIKKDNSIGDQSFNTDGDTTLMIAYQKEIEYISFPIGNSGSSGGSSSSNQPQELSSIWNT